MTTPSSFSTGKKSNSTVTFVDETANNFAVQDQGIALVVDGSPGANVQFTDAGAIDAGREISADAFDFAGRAFDTVERLADSFNASAESIAKSGVNASNIRAQLPAETIAEGTSDLFRVGVIAAAVVAGLFFTFGKGAKA